MNSRFIAVVLVVPATLALAACSSTVNGSPQTAGVSGFPSKDVPSTEPATSGPAPSPSAPSPSAPPTSAPPTSPSPSTPADIGAHLEAQLAQGIGSARTAHIQLAVGVAGQAVLAVGKERLDNGKLVATQLAETIPQFGELDLIIANGKTYAKLPPAYQTGSKPWLLVRAGSSNKTVQILATSLASTKTSASLDSITAFVGAADSIKDLGPITANGLSVTHYSIVVSVAKLPDSYPGKSTLSAAGLTSIPLQLFVDSDGRPVRVKETLMAAGQQIQTKINITKYNQPVTINPPPKSQIGTS